MPAAARSRPRISSRHTFSDSPPARLVSAARRHTRAVARLRAAQARWDALPMSAKVGMPDALDAELVDAEDALADAAASVVRQLQSAGRTWAIVEGMLYADPGASVTAGVDIEAGGGAGRLILAPPIHHVNLSTVESTALANDVRIVTPPRNASAASTVDRYDREDLVEMARTCARIIVEEGIEDGDPGFIIRDRALAKLRQTLSPEKYGEWLAERLMCEYQRVIDEVLAEHGMDTP